MGVVEDKLFSLIDQMILLQVVWRSASKGSKLVGSLIYELCKYKGTEVMDFEIDYFQQQFHQLATVCERVGEKEKNVFGRK